MSGAANVLPDLQLTVLALLVLRRGLAFCREIVDVQSRLDQAALQVVPVDAREDVRVDDVVRTAIENIGFVLGRRS